ncbi:MAG: hypothetical protein FD159_2174 [Syntrophaceae bacterium]|nr:MAG: hypothetical protein FD159_2174 [Syntrophaceae bacterium]
MKDRPIKHFYQQTLFLRWAARNRRLFSHQPYLLQQKKGSCDIAFRGVSKHITCCFTKPGAIMIGADYRNTNFDIIGEFDLYEERTPEGRWLCSMCRDHPHPDKTEPFIEYEDRKEMWIEHSFAPLAAWTRESFTINAVLCLYRDGGSTWAVIEQGPNLKKTTESRYLFKKFPVLTAR